MFCFKMNFKAIQTFLPDSALCREYKVKSLRDFLSSSPEKLCTMLQTSYSVIVQVKKDLCSEHSASPIPGIEEYQNLLEREHHISTGSLKLNELVGGLEGGQVYEVIGNTGSGKTQLCLTATAECLLGGGTVVYIDTRGDFSLRRLEQILTARGAAPDTLHSHLERVSFSRISTAEELWEAVQVVAEEEEKVKLLVIDNLSLPLLKLVTEDQVQGGMYIGCLVSHLLQRIAHTRTTAVLLVSNIKGGGGGGGPPNLPALGAVWEVAANVRLLLERVAVETIRASVLRGDLRPEVNFTINERGVTDC